MRNAIRFFCTRFFRGGSVVGSRLFRNFVQERESRELYSKQVFFYTYSDNRQLYVCKCCCCGLFHLYDTRHGVVHMHIHTKVYIHIIKCLQYLCVKKYNICIFEEHRAITIRSQTELNFILWSNWRSSLGI